MALDRGKLLARFLQEAREHCIGMQKGLVFLEGSPGDRETLDAVCRSAHTVKGAARMMKLVTISSVAHRMEDVFDALKNGRIPCLHEVWTLLFRGVDTISRMLDRVASGTEPDGNFAELCAELERVAGGLGTENPDACGVADGHPVQAETAKAGDEGRNASSQMKPWCEETIRVPVGKIDELIRLMGGIAASEKRTGEVIACLGKALRLSERLSVSAGDPRDRALDELHAILAEAHTSLKDQRISGESFSRQLLEASLSLRTLPLSTVFDSFPRTVRDIALSLGKEVEFLVEGSEIELDKLIIEKIGDPLLHMIRNAVDHGIETGEERLRSGKAGKGTIQLSAWFERGNVMVVLRDDGRGIPLEKVREKALRRQLADRETLDAMSEAQLTEFIFLPGFSTSEMVTDVSGRGVGLDVVRKNIIDDLKGSIRIDSREGCGTAIYMKLPLNLALFRLLFVSAGGREFAFLADSVEEVLPISRNDLINVVNKRAVRLRNEVIPVEELAPLLSLPGKCDDESDRMLIAVVAAGNEKLGLVIDEVVNEESAVVKPLPAHLKKIGIVSGVTVKGRGNVVAVLHVPRLCSAARELCGVRSVPESAATRKELAVLVADDSISTREIEKSIIEAHGYQVVVAGDGLEALEKTRERLFDVVVTDIEMPCLDGFSLTEKLRADERYRHTPIIIVTSREREDDRRRGLMVGANAYIVKGAFDQKTLVETIDSLVA
ncbi:MAG: hybrid sensor histidine kinase/response regulator [Geobacteraceae bacterium]|nr:hybrid sensor histidine kinase/response regulator [Geobacteraceae bacterium]